MMPNVIAGILIGIANTPYIAVLVTSAGWGIIFLVYSILRRSPWITASVYKGRAHKGWGTTRAWSMALLIEFATATTTAVCVGSVVYLIKGWVLS